MTAKAREEILARLRRKQRDAKTPPTWRSRRHFDDLAARFCKALVEAKGEALHVAGVQEALQRIDTLLDELDAARVVVNGDPPLPDVAWAERWPAIEWHVVGRSEGELRTFCADADLGISGASVALAETGSVLVESGPDRSRLATLLPPVHVALIPASRLTTDIFTWTAARERERRPPASMTFISGPSKTGDIEQTLTTGVHGPKRFIAIVYDD